MKYFNLLILKSFFLLALILIDSSRGAFATSVVTVARPEPVAINFDISIEAEVLNKVSEINGRGAYRLALDIPKGVVPAIGVGSLVKVNVHTIHRPTAEARVVAISKDRADLVLDNQVQQLEGQKLKVKLPVRPINLFKIPFQSIVSPRGKNFEVLVLTSDMKVQSVQVIPIQTSGDGDVIVSSDSLKNTSIVVHGTDNLLSGDSVRVNREEVEVLL